MNAKIITNNNLKGFELDFTPEEKETLSNAFELLENLNKILGNLNESHPWVERVEECGLIIKDTLSGRIF